MSGGRVALFAVGLSLSGWACGGAAATSGSVQPGLSQQEAVPGADGALAEDGPAPAWVAGQAPAVDPLEQYAWAVGEGADSEAARSGAVAALAQALWGEAGPRMATLPGMLELLRFEVHAPPARGAAVLALVDRHALQAHLDRLLAQPELLGVRDDPSPSGEIHAAIGKLAHAELCRDLARQRAEAASLACPDLEALKAELAELAPRAALRPSLPHGVPLRAADAALRRLEVLGTWETDIGYNQPFVDMPVRVEGALGELSTITDAEGWWRRELPAIAAGHVRVHVDRDALLGRFADVWPGIAVDVELREINRDTARILVAVEEQVAGQADPIGAAAAAVAARLAEQHLRVVDLDEELSRRCVAKPAACADLTGGGVDVVLIGEAESAFASRMGGRSVWHEAVGSLIIRDAWTGVELGRVRDTARAVGIGDMGAGVNALDKLGHALGAAAVPILEQSLGPKPQARAPHSPLSAAPR